MKRSIIFIISFFTVMALYGQQNKVVQKPYSLSLNLSPQADSICVIVVIADSIKLQGTEMLEFEYVPVFLGEEDTYFAKQINLIWANPYPGELVDLPGFHGYIFYIAAPTRPKIEYRVKIRHPFLTKGEIKSFLINPVKDKVALMQW